VIVVDGSVWIDFLNGRNAPHVRRLRAILGIDEVIQLYGYMASNRLEALKGNRQGQYSIRINNQWRICFEWPSGSAGPINVEIVDYH
jgi:proteic killer suppression protein